MNIEELNEGLEEIREESIRKERELKVKFARENNPVNIGDIVKDHMATIIVESITMSHGIYDIPCCIYRGTRLKKNGEPYKTGEQRTVWQCHILDHVTGGKS